MLGGGNLSLTATRASRSCDRFRYGFGFENCGCPESVNYAWTMPIQSFSFPLPETRFFQAGQHVYKFKIRGGNNCSEVKVMGEEFVNRELENTIRAVLANLDCLQPFTTPHFTVYPYKSKWKRVSKFKFEKMSGEKLSAYPYLVTVYLENNTHTEMCVEECWTPADCVVSDRQTPQNTVGGSVTGGSETIEVNGGHGEEEVHPGAVEEGDPEDLTWTPSLM
ncbi:membrane-anchored junction protein isoform X4 [Oncorhynchus kisutch]|uniref:membrane-anchored junction protein isoform X4 n=1 Tax=Oncorhynchus kisutch TaxID=8019 RepID=UPI0012DD88C8|nr:membrane-anchored junction protein isoform X4 [Oncorhynchus kisutch]